MAQFSKMRASQLTGSYGTADGYISDQGAAIATGSVTSAGLDEVLSHLASSIKRVHGKADFSSNVAGTFYHSIVPGTDDSYDLGSASAAWQDLHMEGDVLMTDAGKVSAAAGDLEIESAAGSVQINAAEAAADAIVLHAENASGGIDMSVNSNVVVSLDADSVDIAQEVVISDANGLKLGAGGNEFSITESSDDVTLASLVSDKDMIFSVNDGGAATEVFRLDGDVSALKLASGKKLMLGAAEEAVSGDGTDISFEVGAGGDINIPANIGLTFGDDGEKIEGDGTDLTISGNNINLTAAADVIVTGDLVPAADDTHDLGTSAAAWQDLHLEGDVLMTDAGKVSAGAGVLTVESAASHVVIDAAGDIELNADGGDILFMDATQMAMTVKMDTVAGDAVFLDAGDTEIFRIDGSADSLLMASSKKIEFGDDGTYIHQSADGVLDLVSDTEIEINATTIDMNGALDLSGNATIGGNAQINGNLTVLGAATQISSSNTSIKDALIVLNFHDGDAVIDQDAGIIFAQPGESRSLFVDSSDSDKFKFVVTDTSGSATQVDTRLGGAIVQAARWEVASATDYVAMNGSDLAIVAAADVKVTGDLVPSADDTYDLGTSSLAWQDLHMEGDILMTDAGKLATAAGNITLDAANGGSDVVVLGDLVPSADDTYDLGTANAAWQDLHLEGDILMTDAGKLATAAGDLTLDPAGNNVIPGSDDTDYLGASGTAWKGLYLTQGSARGIFLDDDADTGIRSQADDSIEFQLGGNDIMGMLPTAFLPVTAGAVNLGAADAEWGDVYIADDKKLYFGSGQDASIEYDEDGTDELRFAGAAVTFEQAVTFDGAVTLGNATGDDIVVTGYVASHVIPKTDATYDLGSSNLGYNDLHLGSGGVINLDGGDVTLTHAAGKVTLGGDGAVEFDFANHEMTNVDIDSGAIDGTVIGAASAANGTFLALDCTDGAFAIANLDIDGGNDIGAALADADEIIVDDGGNGTNRKSDMSRVATYVFSKVQKVEVVVSAAVNANSDVALGFNTPANWTDTAGGSKELYLNGQLMMQGADASANKDFYDSATAGAVKFEFGLQPGDVIQAVLRMA